MVSPAVTLKAEYRDYALVGMKIEHSRSSFITRTIKGREYGSSGVKMERPGASVFMKMVNRLNASNINYHEIHTRTENGCTSSIFRNFLAKEHMESEEFLNRIVDAYESSPVLDIKMAKNYKL